MNATLSKIVYDMGKVNSIMKYLETLCTEKDEDTAFAFFALSDQVRSVNEDIEKLMDDSSIVDIIKAVRK